MRIATLLKQMAKVADSSPRQCSDADKYSDEELSEIARALAALQNSLGDVDDLWKANGRPTDIWRG